LLEIRKLGDPVLREKCAQVTAVDKEMEALIAGMCDALTEKPGRAGLAAPQVGVPFRFFVYDAGFGPRVLINPSVVESSGELLVEEGCLSLPGVYVTLKRYEHVKVRGTTLSGHNIVMETEGFVGQLLQHECDHLDGVLMIDRCESEEKERAIAEFEQLEMGLKAEEASS
jgi:peptide deformylase